MNTDLLVILSLVISACVAAALVFLYKKGILNGTAISAVGDLIEGVNFGNSFLTTLSYYCGMAVKAVEQMVKAGELGKDNYIRKDAAVDFVINYAAVDGFELTDDEMEAVETLIEAKVYEQRMEEKQKPPEETKA